MCGLNGIYACSAAANLPDRGELIATRDHMLARGPDGAGEWWSEDRRLGLGHRRLSIIDLSDRASQPMASPCGRFVVVFNGEIYNYPELRRQLQNQRRQFRTTSDTEVLLHLYALKGAEMVHHLRGMFAFAIWDNAERRLFLARDPYGIKPLYTAHDGRTFRFASQVKALLAGGGVSRDLEPAGVVGFHVWGSVPEPFTLYRDIRALPAGHTQVVDATGPNAPRPYCSLAEILAEGAENPVPRAEIVPRVREAVRDSVAAHLVADVEVGIFLSRGVDSGALLGLMRDLGQDKIRALTLAFGEYAGSELDEAPVATEIAQRYGAEHFVRKVGEAEFHSDLPKILAAMDQPTIDGVNMWFIAKAAREAGLKVALSGLGGDELFAGYPAFREIPLSVRALSLPTSVPGIGRAWRAVADMLGLSRNRPKVSGLLSYGGTYPGAYLLRRGLFLPFELDDQLDPDLVKAGLKRLKLDHRLRQSMSPEPASSLSRVAALESANYMRNQLLRDIDWAGMTHSVEVRTPLVDVDLLRNMSAVIPLLQEGAGKAALAAAPRNPLPDTVAKRPKLGFVIPTEHWLADRSNVIRASRGQVSRRWAKEVLANFAPEMHGKRIQADTAASSGAEAKARILMLASDAHGGRGGIAQYNRDVLAALSKCRQIRETVVLTRTKAKDDLVVPEKVRYDQSSTKGLLLFILRSFVNALGSGGFDLIYCAHINFLPLAAVLSRLRGVPLVLAIYGIDAWERPRSWIYRLSTRAPDVVISISQITLDRYLSWSNRPPGIAVVPNAIDPGLLAPGGRDRELEESLDLAGRKVILTFGRMVFEERYKGFDEVIELMPRLRRRHPDLVYLLAGDGDDRQRLEERAQELGVSDIVRFSGYVPEASKADYYRLADAYIMPSQGEGFGFVVLEALACGIPVVASTVDGTREAVRGGELGLLVDPEDSEALELAILEALQRRKAVPSGLEYFSFLNFEHRLLGALAGVLPASAIPQ